MYLLLYSHKKITQKIKRVDKNTDEKQRESWGKKINATVSLEADVQNCSHHGKLC